LANIDTDFRHDACDDRIQLLTRLRKFDLKVPVTLYPSRQYAIVPKNFLVASRSFVDVNTLNHDFQSAARCAFWNTRASVVGFSSLAGNAHESVLQGRFVSGTGLRGANLKRVFVDEDKAFEESHLAFLLLTSSFASYEGYVEEIARITGASDTSSKKLQWPTSTTKSGTRRGFLQGLDEVTRSPNRDMTKAYATVLQSSPKYALSYADDLMVIYRQFKEVRNALIHRRGVADAKAETADSVARSLSPLRMGMRDLPEMPQVKDGARVTLSLRGVIGFTDVLLRLVTTIDAEVAVTDAGATELMQRWRDAYGGLRPLPAVRSRRDGSLRILLNRIGFPNPDDTNAAYVVLRSASLVL
jgi:hypothetical protein